MIQTLTATGTSTPASPVNAGGNVTLFFQAALTTNDLAPLITVPPSNQVVNLGDTAVFTVTATGLDLSYQWQLDGTNLPGKTLSTLTITTVNTNNVGAYTVIVSNAICWESATAALGSTWSSYLTNEFDASPAIGPDGTIYIANMWNSMFALDPALGHVIWSAPIQSGSDMTSSPAVAADGSAVYVGSQDDFLYSFNPTNGAVLWRTFLGSAIFSSPAISASDGTVYVCTYEPTSNGLFAINGSNGVINWYFQTDDPNGIASESDSSPAIAPDGSIVFLARVGDLYAVKADGNLKWFFPLPANSFPDSSPAIDAAGNVVIGSHDGYVYCISSSGGLEWIFDTTNQSAPIHSSAAIGPDSTVYIASTDGTLYAITNGGMKWEFTDPSGAGFFSSPAISQDNVIVIGSEDNYVYGITNGYVKWSQPTSGQVRSSRRRSARLPGPSLLHLRTATCILWRCCGSGEFPLADVSCQSAPQRRDAQSDLFGRVRSRGFSQ